MLKSGAEESRYGSHRDNASYEIVEESVSDDSESDENKQAGERKKRTTATDALVVVKKRRLPFQKFKRRLPSYTRVSQRHRGNTIDKKEEQQPLTMNEGGDHDKDEQNCDDKCAISQTLMKKLSNSKDCIDPSQYPLEQITDAEYGLSASVDHSNVDHSSLKQKKRKLIVVISAITLIITCTILLLIRRSLSGDIQEPSTHGLEPPANISITKAPNDVGSLCSDASIASTSGFIECQSACLPGQCCFTSTPFESQEVTTNNSPKITQPCSESHQDVCKSYTPCLSMQGMESPTDLVNQKCAPNNIRYPEGRQDCEAACKPRRCCFAKLPEEKCPADSKAKVRCDEYKVCQILYSSSFPNSSGTDIDIIRPFGSVDTLCTNDTIRYIKGREDCESVCALRKCCLSSQEDNCLEGNESWCAKFNVCAILHRPLVQISDYSNDEAQNLLKTENCHNFLKLSSNDFDYCKASCNNAICCLVDDMHCDDIDCTHYQYCSEIRLVVHPKDSLSDVVKNENNASENKDFPLIGSPIGGEDGLQEGPILNQVNSACNINDANLNECYYLCSSYLCCFYDTYDPYSCHTSDICAKYSACFKLIDADVPGGLATEISTTNYEEGLYPADEMCSIEYLSLKGGIQLCEALCIKHMCCFGGDTPCTYRDDCPVYQACGVLENDDYIVKGSEGVLVFNFDRICSLHSLETIGGQSACTHICKPYLCCNTGDCEHLSDCNTVAAAACNRDHEYPETSTLITSITSETSPECIQLCSEGTKDWQNNVCNTTEIGSCSCSYDEDTSCSLYCDEPGTWVMECDGDSSFPNNIYNRAPPPVDLGSFCSLELITLKDRFQITKCLDICNVAECCKEETCLEEVSFCNSYVSCHTVWKVASEKNAPEIGSIP